LRPEPYTLFAGLLRQLRTDARARHDQALAIATDIAALPEEARALEGLGRCHLRDGEPSQGAALLGRALVIYQRIGSPNARRVATTLRDHNLGGFQHA